MSKLHRRFAGRIALMVTVALVAISLPPTTAQAASGNLTFVGHGYGHGRGMGQYGALGYAVNYGWSSAQILDHFYGGTVKGTVGNPDMRVELLGHSGKPLVVTGPGLKVNATVVGGGAVRLTLSGSNVIAARATGCGSTVWTNFGTYLASNTRVTTSAPATSLDNLLSVCNGTGKRAYRGSLAVVNVGGTQKTINHLPTESYLRGVVPRESLASWATLGAGKGKQALQAQAVAARSYALASPRSTWAQTCDTTACQVYDGAGTKVSATAAWTLLEDSRTDAAIGATALVVRKFKSGAIARTEFSSSTGGWTAGGTFPAVVDAGDAAQSPYHTWTTTLPLSTVAAKLGTGTIRTIGVTARNGLGENGGRVTNVRVVSTAGVVRDFTGNAVRLALGLKSDWFTVSGTSLAEAQSVVKALYADLLLRPVDPSGLATWSAILAGGGSQTALVASLTKSKEYIQRRITQGYKEVLGRTPDAGGMATWTREILAGRVAVDDVQRVFYTSSEFYLRAGGTPRGFINLMYHTAFLRAPTAAESAYWSGRIAAVGRGGVLHGIWFSLEAAMYRAGNYYQVFLRRAPDLAGQRYWANILLSKGEGAVRIGIAGSTEYRLLASVRFH